MQDKKSYWKKFDKLIVTNHTSKFDVNIFADFDIKRIDTHSQVPGQKNRKDFNLSKVRNASLDYAAENNYDFLVVVDVDCIVYSYPSNLDDKRIGGVKFRCKSGEEIFDSRSNCRTGTASWFIIPKSLFHLRWHEGFVGYGWEDMDWAMNVVGKRGYKTYGSNMECAHISHKEEFPDGKILKNNSALFERRKSI